MPAISCLIQCLNFWIVIPAKAEIQSAPKKYLYVFYKNVARKPRNLEELRGLIVKQIFFKVAW